MEDVFYHHPAVLEAGVVGVSDPKEGEIIKAYIVLKSDHAVTEKELLSFARQHLAAYKVPERIGFLDVLPKGKTDKIDREKLREDAIHED